MFPGGTIFIPGCHSRRAVATFPINRRSDESHQDMPMPLSDGGADRLAIAYRDAPLLGASYRHSGHITRRVASTGMQPRERSVPAGLLILAPAPFRL